MLRDESKTREPDRPLSSVRRILTLFGLLGLTMGVATLRGPARGADDGPSSATQAVEPAPQLRDPSKSFVAPYVREGTDGAAVIRPAAAFRHKGLDPLLALFRSELGEDLAMFAKKLNVDTSRQGFLNLRLQDIEWVTAGIGFGRSRAPTGAGDKHPSPAGAAEMPLHSIRFGSLAARIVGPFDWLAFLRQWRFESEETQVKGRTYYKVTGEFKKMLGLNPCVFLPDDRTIVFDEENVIRMIAGGDDSAPPAYLSGKEWERASRGLVAVAIKNRDETFAKRYDLGRPDDAVVLSLFKGVDQWIVSADDADPILLRADATCHDRDAIPAIRRSLDSVMELGRQYRERDVPKSPDAETHGPVVLMFKALATNVRVEHTGSAITVQARNFGSLADFAAIVAGEAQESKARVANRKDANHAVKQ